MLQSSKLLKKIGYIIDAISQFPNKQDSLFNVSKLKSILLLSDEEMDQILKIIFKLQDQFSILFKDYQLRKIWKNGTIFLTLIPKDHCKNDFLFSKEISLTPDHSNLLNDIIYYFEHVKIGKGFNLHINGTMLSKKVNELYKTHPYLFESRGNGLIYPTNLAVKIGKQLYSYNKGNREVCNLQIDEYDIIIR
ncbi:MAG: hypothetical protein ACFFBW_07935 [Promethearchaeota archaeon]